VQNVVADANNRNVSILLWKRSSELNTSAQRSAYFQQLKNTGVAGCKVDFFDFNGVSAGSRERVQLMRDILKDAAGYQLVVTFHGTSKPVGLFKTYPNLLQVEAIFGKESYAGGFNMTTQPFVRFLAGPADFTPLSLQGPFKGGRTSAFEIASVATMPGPLVTLAERSDIIYNSPFRDVIRAIPSMWDETRVLSQSSLGNTCAMARRKESEWFLAITNRGTNRSWSIPLSFLSSGVSYSARIVRDSSTGIENSTVNSGSSLAVTAANEGGSLPALFLNETFPASAAELASKLPERSYAWLRSKRLPRFGSDWTATGLGLQRVRHSDDDVKSINRLWRVRTLTTHRVELDLDFVVFIELVLG
jgi:alpha-glucosidase